VLVHDPDSRRLTVMVGNLCFPNGVALSGDERSLFIAETGEYRIWKIDVAVRGLDARAAAAGGDSSARVVATNLPGFPDNLTRGADGRLWTAFTKPRSAAADRLAAWPRLRAMTLRLPRAFWPVPPAYGHVIAFDEDGRVVADLQDPGGRLGETSGATESGGRLYVHSLHAPALGVLAGKAVGP
jgi:sugar lactone lactonase YvrE